MAPTVRSQASVEILQVRGLNAQDMVRVKNRISRLIDKNRTRLILDLRGARHIDLFGLGILVERLGKVRALNGDLKLVGLNPYILKVLKATQVGKLIKTYGNTREALRSFKGA